MSNATCVSSGLGSVILQHHGGAAGASSPAATNLMALSVLLNSLQCNPEYQNADQNFKDASDHFKYMNRPLAAITDITESSQRLVSFTENEFLNKEVVKVGKNIYVAIGYALANSIMIEGPEGIIIIDATESENGMSEIMDEFRKITNKPVKAIILTHFHTGMGWQQSIGTLEIIASIFCLDHILGTKAIIEKEKISWPDETIEIISHESIFEQMLGFAATYGVGYKRGFRQFGTLLPKILGIRTGSGIGPYFRLGKNVDVHIPMPTTTFRNRKRFHAGGIEFELIHTPGETDDQTTVWLPKEQAVFPADNIYKAFPNLYAIRGSPARDAKLWYTSLDRTRELGAEYLIGSHGRPISGKGEIHHTLLAYRDAIKFIHDQTLRLLNKGYFPNQIVQEIKLPDVLAHHPFLQEHYGTVEWSIRGIYSNYLGWFSGDPKDLHPMSENTRADMIMKLVSYASKARGEPVDIILQHAQLSHIKSYYTYLSTGKHDINEDKWALEMVDHLLESNALSEDLEHAARQIKISALRAIGSEEISANGRNYLMTYAMEVEAGKEHFLDSSGTRKHAIKTSPIKRVLNTICSKVNGLKCQHENYTVGYSFTDVNVAYTMTLRNSVCDVFPEIVKPNHIHLEMTAQDFKLAIAGELDLVKLVSEGRINFMTGSGTLMAGFLSCFDSK